MPPHEASIHLGISRGDFVYVLFSPIRSDPPKTRKQMFATHPVPGQSPKFVNVYMFSFPEFRLQQTACNKQDTLIIRLGMGWSLEGKVHKYGIPEVLPGLRLDPV